MKISVRKMAEKVTNEMNLKKHKNGRKSNTVYFPSAMVCSPFSSDIGNCI